MVSLVFPLPFFSFLLPRSEWSRADTFAIFYRVCRLLAVSSFTCQCTLDKKLKTEICFVIQRR